MRLCEKLMCAALALLTMHAVAADELSGTWKFSKSGIYFTSDAIAPAPEYHTLQIINDQVLLQPKCDIATVYLKEDYDYSDFFQLALTAGAEEGSMTKYLKKNFGFNIEGVRKFYVGHKLTKKCASGLSYIFPAKDQLIFAGPGGSFNSYKRSSGGTTLPLDPAVNLYGRKLSQLPYRANTFNVLCAEIIPRVKFIHQQTEKCAPVYYPYVVSKSDTDPLAKLIGSHNYMINGSDAQKDYVNPASHDLHPVYMLLPPQKDVLVVAVEDLETGDSRPGMAGVYLSIKNDKIVDQITASCVLNEDYSCADLSGKKMYQLRENGKFERISR